MNPSPSTHQTSSHDSQEHEIELWLTTKLNADWSSERIANHLTTDIVGTFANQYERLKYLETPVKLRLLMCCLSLKKKSLADMSQSFQTLVQKGMNDAEEDEWIRVISDILSSYPSHNCLKTSITVDDEGKEKSLSTMFADTVELFKNSMSSIYIYIFLIFFL